MSQIRVPLLGIALASLVFSGSAYGVSIPIGTTWQQFSFFIGQPAQHCDTTCIAGPNSVYVGDGPWTFTNFDFGFGLVFPSGFDFQITDAFNRGDSFNVFDFGVFIGSTPGVAALDSCGSDPDACFSDPLVSHAVFALGPSNHSITITVASSVTGGGTAYFRVLPRTAAIPEPGTLALLGLGLIGFGLIREKQTWRIKN